ncbi:MAG: tyrosine-type recombinase/integrase [Planctomycetes bacterium]|nr:tyrosine-type recombinase/integrase [Planctomycetota bacterium]MCP4772480.1 tyrosine-type recombinase/integrase [Planctomycetota bacterium]MCP4860127.1 tyrosine-type recombinase/integrase [Planctomycetota bacterium]
MQARLNEYVGSLAAEAGLAPLTIEAYRRDLSRAAAFLGERKVLRWQDLSADDIADLLAVSRTDGLAPASQVRLLSSLRGLFRWLRAEEGLEGRDPTRVTGKIHLWNRLPEVLSPEDARLLLDAPSPDTWIGQRDRALLALLYGGGLRVSEAVGLKLDGLSLRAFVGDEAPGVLHVLGKGNKERLVPFGGIARLRLEHWLEEGRATRPKLGRHVLLSKSGKALDRHRAFRIVRQHALKIGLDAYTHPHILRHSCATHLLIGGGDLRSVQEFLGHADLRTTERYTHLEVEQLQSYHKLHHPRG